MSNDPYTTFIVRPLLFVTVFLIIHSVLLLIIGVSVGKKLDSLDYRKIHEASSDLNILPHTERNVNIMLKDVIRRERIKHNLSLSELARRCGHAVSTLHAIETGVNNNPSYRTIADICTALGLSLDQLEERIKENTDPKNDLRK